MCNARPAASFICSILPNVSAVAKSLEFAPEVMALANRIVANMTRGGQLPLNAAHLRIEKDAKDWTITMGGRGVGAPSPPLLILRLLVGSWCTCGRGCNQMLPVFGEEG